MIENSSKGNGTGCSNSRLSSQWLRNPRIVRVSRALGGKDRHSKVCTVRGLRDRRIRLSVPTAIQLYDLQDRLGLSQPSKVVDWLLEATKSDIDKLPPLHINPHCDNFPQFQSLVPLNVGKSRYNYLDLDVNSSLKGKEVAAYNGGMACHFSQFGSHGLLFPNNNNSNWQQQQQQQHEGADNNSSNSQFLFSATPSFLAIESDPPKQYFNNNNAVLHQMLNSSSSSSSSQVMPPINNVLFHSPLKRLPTLFSSKLLDLDHNNNNRSQPGNKSDTS